MFPDGHRDEFGNSNFNYSASVGLDDNVFAVGDCIVINDVNITSDIDIEMFYVYTPSQLIIRHMVLHAPTDITPSTEVNQPPVANAGSDQSIYTTNNGNSNVQVTLDGSGSTDDGLISPLTYNWIWSGGSATGVRPTIYLPKGDTTIITLRVYDGQLYSATDTVTISISKSKQ